MLVFKLTRIRRPAPRQHPAPSLRPAQDFRAGGGGDPSTQGTSKTVLHFGLLQDTEGDRHGLFEPGRLDKQALSVVNTPLDNHLNGLLAWLKSAHPCRYACTINKQARRAAQALAGT